MTARIGDHFGLDDGDRCESCGHMPGTCGCGCCEDPPEYQHPDGDDDD